MAFFLQVGLEVQRFWGHSLGPLCLLPEEGWRPGGKQAWLREGGRQATLPEPILCHFRRQGSGSSFEQLVSSSCLSPLRLPLRSASWSVISGGRAVLQSSAYCSPRGRAGEKRGCSQDSACCTSVSTSVHPQSMPEQEVLAQISELRTSRRKDPWDSLASSYPNQQAQVPESKSPKRR